MQYKVGMYGGSFDPLHIGHINCMIKAASKCEELYIVISYSRNRDNIPVEYRYRWIFNSFKHMQNIKILLLEDTAVSKEEYDQDSYWETGRDYVLSQIGKSVDVVFCGSDYIGSDRYEKLYGCKVEYFDRDEIKISSTEIRGDVFKYWDYIPNIARPYFTKRVLLIGGESTGKSTLTQNLALHYNTNFLEEVGRNVCDYAGGNEDLMIEEDFHEILIQHKAKEMEIIKQSNKLLFIDTDALITKFFSRFLLEGDKQKRNDALADAITAINKFDMVIFLEPTVAFVQDGTRNEKLLEDRKGYSEQIKSLFDEQGISYHVVDGDYLERYTTVQNLIKEKYGL